MNRKLRILFFTLGLCPGGTERQIIELCKGIDRNRFDLTMSVARPGGELEEILKSLEIKIEYFPFDSLRTINAINQFRRLRSFIIRNKIDILHTYSLLGNTFGALAGLLARVPLIVTSRRDMFSPFRLPNYERLQAALSHCVDNTIVNASAIKRMLIEKEHADPDKISIIRNGIDLSRFVERSCRSAARRELGVDDDAPVIGAVAELKQIKGHIYLLRAVRQMVGQLPKLRLLLLGGGLNEPHTEAALRQAVSELGITKNVIFHGRSTEVPRLLTALDVSVLPSLSEGLSNTILESMAAGTPVVATEVGGTPEIIFNGENGLLVPPKDPEALTAAILSLLKDRTFAQRLADKAQSMVKEHFSNEQMIAATESLYLRLARSKKARPGLADRFALRRRIAV